MNEWKGEYWNTRFIEKTETWKSEKFKDKEYFNKHFDLHEVHYDENNNPVAWTAEPGSLQFADESDVKGTLKHLKDALKRHVLKIEGHDLIDTGKFLKDYKEDDLTNFNPEIEWEHHCHCEEEE